MKDNSRRQGVYFMANNKVLDLTIAFLNSYRMHNKELPLCLIPYNKDHNKILELKDIYNFSIYNNQDYLEICDDISVRFHGNVVGAYRKLVAWEGDFEEFVYIDIDTVVTDNLSFVWGNLNHCKIFTSHSNVHEIRKWVWKDSIYYKNKLNHFQIEYAANTGFIVSSKKTLSKDWVLAQVDKALELKDDMELFCMEQPFLNYLIVTSGYNYGSLLRFYSSKINKGTNRKVKFEFWAGTKGAKISEGRLFNTDPNGNPVFLVHWAGVWRENGSDLNKIPYKKLWNFYRNLDPLKLPEPKYESSNGILSRFLNRVRNQKIIG